jgi:hypothetical protein
MVAWRVRVARPQAMQASSGIPVPLGRVMSECWPSAPGGAVCMLRAGRSGPRRRIERPHAHTMGSSLPCCTQLAFVSAVRCCHVCTAVWASLGHPLTMPPAGDRDWGWHSCVACVPCTVATAMAAGLMQAVLWLLARDCVFVRRRACLLQPPHGILTAHRAHRCGAGARHSLTSVHP